MVSGAIALLLQNHPNLTPDQIKKLLVNSASAYPGQTDRAGTLNIDAALDAAAHPPAAGFVFPQPVGGTTPPSGSNAVVWDGARWGNTFWDGARWGAAHWDGARWGSDYWDAAHWDAAHWDAAHWDAAHWDGSAWSAAHWDSYGDWN
jgi:serine protease AprX